MCKLKKKNVTNRQVHNGCNASRYIIVIKQNFSRVNIDNCFVFGDNASRNNCTLH